MTNAASVIQSQAASSFVTGALLRETWLNIPGSTLADLTNNARFPDAPDQTSPVNLFEIPPNAADNYGVRLSGYLRVTVSGSYIFYLSSDDEGALFLSSDDDPAKKRLIAQEQGWNGSREWINGSNQGSRGNPPANISDPINLVTGRWYYVEAVLKEDAGSDILGVTWRIPGANPVANGAEPIPGPYLAYGTPEPHGPFLDSAQTRGNPTGLTVTFSDPVDDATATNPANYSIDRGVTVNGVSLIERAKVRLTTSPIADGQLYTLTVNNVRNQANPPTAIAPNSQITFFPAQGVIKRKEFYNVSGTRLSDMTNNVKFPSIPDLVADSTSLEASVDVRNNYGVQFEGFVTAPVTGDYIFYVCSDDQGALFLSTNENPANKRLIAFEPEWNSSRNWTGTDRRPNRENISAPIRLEAGRQYCLEALVKEGEGGDNLAVTWQKPGDFPPINGAPPIPGEFLSTLSAVVGATITQQPAGETVNEFGSATFNVGVSGSPPYDYQWFKNGTMIPGANGPSLTLNSISYVDNGSVFGVQTGNGLANMRSADAVLTVVADRTPPVVSGAEGSPSLDKVTLRFSEPINRSDAQVTANYRIDGGLGVLGASLLLDGRSVLLTTPTQTTGVRYTVTLSSVRDVSAAENAISANSQSSFTAFVLSPGFLRREVFSNISGVSLDSLTNNSKFPNQPDQVSFVSQFETPSTTGDNYGAKLSGFLIPPITGQYVFYLSSDDQGALFLSSDDTSANKRLIAFEPQWNYPRNWVGTDRRNPANPENRSVPVSLEAGRRYYVEALKKQATYGDSFGVTWQLPGAPPPANYNPPIPGAYLATYASPDGATIKITLQPQDVAVAEGQEAGFKLRATTSSPNIAYQWQRNNADIPGAVFRDYTLPLASLSDHGAKLRCLVRIPGASIFSQEAALKVDLDATPPVLVSAEGSIGRTRVTVRFSEPIRPGDATNAANYAISGGITVERAELNSDGRTVVLKTSPQTGGTQYNVTVNGIRDTSSVSNPLALNSRIFFTAHVPEEFVGPFPSWADAKRDYGAKGDGIADDTAALQRALNELGNPGQPLDTIVPGRPYVLWLPSGTYRITQGLKFNYRIAVSVFGEDPATTIIKWDGPQDGVMLHCNGVSHHRVGRLTFDGAGRAHSAIAHKWDGTNQPHATNGSEYSDLIIRDVQYGIRAGVSINDAEVAVLRCHFLRCSTMGISMESYNALDWWVRHSVFEECGIGAGNVKYAGACHVYDSLFLRSMESDLAMGNCTEWLAFRRNTSVGSKAFFVVGFSNCGSRIVMQGNTIVDAQDATPIRIANLSQLLLFDNIIKSRSGAEPGPVIKLRYYAVSIGNTFTVPKPFEVEGTVLATDDRIVDRDSLGTELPELSGTLPNLRREIFEVSVGATAAQIQQVINAADTKRGLRPVVHLPAGVYPIEQTLVIPAGSDVQVVGDGFRAATALRWVGTAVEPVIRLQGPSRATLRDFTVFGDSRAHGIVIDNCDQRGARVSMDGLGVAQNRNNILVDRLDHTTINLHNFNGGGALISTDEASFKVIGGPRLARGDPAEGRLAIFGGAPAGENLVFDVINGGSLFVQDFWWEGNSPQIMRLSGQGRFTFDGGLIAPNMTLGVPAVEVGDFQGSVSFVATSFAARNSFRDGTGLAITSSRSDTEVLVLATQGYNPRYVSNRSTNGTVLALGNLLELLGGEDVPLPDVGEADPFYLKRMLAPIRAEQPRPLSPLAPGLTDVRINRCFVWYCDIGIRLGATNSPPFLPAIPDQVILEHTTLNVTNVVMDADSPFDSHVFSLGPDAPRGASINSTNGILTWTPLASDVPSTNYIKTIVADNGSPRMFATNIIAVIVIESNLPPILGIAGEVTNSHLSKVVSLFGTTPFEVLRPPPQLESLDNGQITLDAGGYLFVDAGSAGTPDSATFAYDRVAGDFDARVQLVSLEALRPESQAGLVVRESLDFVSRTLVIMADPAGVTQDGRIGRGTFTLFRRLLASGGVGAWNRSGGTASLPNAWMRIRRQGQLFTAFWSNDGRNWNELSRLTPTPPFAEELYVGIGATSGWFDRNAHFEFQNFSLSSSGFVPIPNDAINELSSLSLDIKATDSNRPKQQLTFSLDPNAPAGATLDSATGNFTWTPTETQGPGNYPITVRVTDNGLPPLSDSKTFNVTVNEVNSAPVLAAISNQVMEEGRELVVTATATDADIPANVFTYTLVSGAPSGMTMDSATGVIKWTPPLGQGSGPSPVTVRVTDNATPPLSDAKSFNVTVALKPNTAPVLAPIADQTLNELTTLSIDLSATDADLPANALAYSVVSAPPGVTVNPFTGRLTWTPTEAQGPSTSVIALLVTDNGTPPLSDTKTFTVTVNEVNELPVLAAIPDKNANVGSLLSFAAIATDGDLSANTLTFALEPGAPEGATIDPATGVLTWTPAAAQAGTTNRISIRATDNGVPPLSDTKAFTVVVAALASVPAHLSVSLLANGEVRLVWTTTPGRSYTLQRSANLADWQDLITSNATDVSSEYVDTEAPTASARFYRVVQR